MLAGFALKLGPVYMIPARQDGMPTEIPLIIQTLMSVYMMQLLISPNWDPGMRWRDLGKAGREIRQVNTPSRSAGMM